MTRDDYRLASETDVLYFRKPTRIQESRWGFAQEVEYCIYTEKPSAASSFEHFKLPAPLNNRAEARKMLAATMQYYQSPPPPAYGVSKPAVQYYMEPMPTSSLFYACAARYVEYSFTCLLHVREQIRY